MLKLPLPLNISVSISFFIVIYGLKIFIKLGQPKLFAVNIIYQ